MTDEEYEAKLDEYQAVYLYYIAQAEKDEAQIASLRAQLAEAQAAQWTPVPDGWYDATPHGIWLQRLSVSTRQPPQSL